MNKRIFGTVILCVLLLLLAGAALFSGNPEIHAAQFVRAHQGELEEAYQTGVVPAGIGYQVYNLWDGEHPMMEFILSARGSTYYGCYYSPDGVPLPFQNVDVDLAPTGQTEWTWKADGDNHGVTTQITDGWYYFEASF